MHSFAHKRSHIKTIFCKFKLSIYSSFIQNFKNHSFHLILHFCSSLKTKRAFKSVWFLLSIAFSNHSKLSKLFFSFFQPYNTHQSLIFLLAHISYFAYQVSNFTWRSPKSFSLVSWSQLYTLFIFSNVIYSSLILSSEQP